MIYTETKGKLFETTDYYAYCINANLEYTDALPRQFNTKFNIKNRLQQQYSDKVKTGNTILYGKVFSLIIKDKYKDAPRYMNLNKSLMEMKKLCIKFDIKKVIIPKLGDKFYDLEYSSVKNAIVKVFNGIDIEIVMMEV